jgi:hypothetical protein
VTRPCDSGRPPASHWAPKPLRVSVGRLITRASPARVQNLSVRR